MIKKVGVLFVLVALVLAPNAGFADVGKIADAEAQKEIKEIKAMFADLQNQLTAANKTIAGLKGELAAVKTAPGTVQRTTPAAVPTVGTGEITCGTGTRNLEIGGYMQVDYRHGQQVKAGQADTFDIRRLYLSFKGQVSDCVDYRVLLQMPTSTSSTGDVTVLNAYVTWKCIDIMAIAAGDWEGRYNPEARGLNLRLGSQIVPFGIEGSMSSSNLTMIERTYGDGMAQQHQLGVSAFGDFLDKRLAYSVGVYNNGYMNGFGTESSDDNKMVAARITAVPFQGEVAGFESNIKVGSSWSYEKVNGGSIPTPVGIDSLSRGTFTGEDMRMGLDGEINIGDFRLRSEFIRVLLDPSGTAPSNDANNFGRFSTNTFYVEPSYFVIPDKLQLAYRWESIKGDQYANGAAYHHSRINAHVFGVNYNITPYQKVMLNYAYTNGTANPDDNERSQLLARYQICF